MIKSLFIAISALSAIIVSTISYAETQHKMVIGEARLLEVENITDIIVGEAKVIDVSQLSSHQIIIRGIQAGKSQLLLVHAGGEVVPHVVTVTSELSDTLRFKLEAILANEADVQWTEEAGFAILDGETSAAKVELVKQLQAESPHVLSRLTIMEPTPQSIELHVTMLEVKRSAAQQLGVQWAAASAGPSYTRLNASPWQFPFALSSTIQMLEQTGAAQLLAQPRLIAQVGETARFLAGGEIPIPQVVADGLQDVEFREYGIRLEMTPRLLASGDVEAAFMVEVSSIDGAVSVGGIPGILTRRSESLVSGRLGETWAIAGLVNKEHSTAIDRLPYLGSLPILGKLFHSKDFKHQRSELLVLVTPMLASQKRASGSGDFRTQRRLFREKVGCTGVSI